MAKLIVLSFPSAVCSFSSYYPVPAVCNLPRSPCNRRWISAVSPESFSKFQRDILLPMTPQLFCSFASSCFLYSANLTSVINCNYTNIKWQKSYLDRIGKICIMYKPEAGLLSLGSLFTVGLLCLGDSITLEHTFLRLSHITDTVLATFCHLPSPSYLELYF